ncbi:MULTISPECIES: alpha/beta hydrolase family protein [unclassified Polaromonas]|jgi:pimeloyl-ACP methyl ester carboxylesterase|uniref:alpha/beta fold hydrolase n=1 Tax=unclassified Polaromonas TaxID=2638319 RepID=UPI000BC7B755|nr:MULTISPECIES: alpha/beta hydrolase family protein [unclassified Polaromonas]OYY33063.1 MAG: esterase [Polaromonas sp. 35-63-35]OYZ17242.1 MAG: esterase [Polaromonas sp. 16-63-31]OYZ76493.1 MAG: esterase [Polaromonas sp. 24-63-21]OZA47560.1 MAG: esterase [Polaromonas sp. 17-63-33]OZA85641.1 MAG: esterase [Polaromonas sp. 39-63-25]
MANFVLVHGAWHGGWCWQRVTLALQQQGHRVHAVTLTGLGERAHLLAPSITLDTHIDDVISAIEVEELHDVILAVHSYAGMIGTAVADRLGKHLKHLVYVDAVVPKPGESWSSTQSAATQQQRLSAAQASTRFSFPPPDPEVFGLHDADHAWVKRRQTPHPGNTYQAPLDFDIKRVAAIPRTFVNCTQPALATIEPSRLRVKDPKFWDGAWLPNSKIVELKTGHDPMISDPAGLTRILLDCAA